MSQTLQQRLSIFCEKNKLDMPFGNHLLAISYTIVERIKAMGDGVYETVGKVSEAISVNNYPEELLAVVDQAVEEYFANRNLFAARSKNSSVKKKYFNYDVETEKINAFERALKIMGVDVNINFRKEKVTQYKIPASNPVFLINLGRLFQKQRFVEKCEDFNKNKR